MIQPPCYNCNRRQRLCHAKCERYKTFRAEFDRITEAERQAKRYKEYICERIIQAEKWSKNHERG